MGPAGEWDDCLNNCLIFIIDLHLSEHAPNDGQALELCASVRKVKSCGRSIRRLVLLTTRRNGHGVDRRPITAEAFNFN